MSFSESDSDEMPAAPEMSSSESNADEMPAPARTEGP
jgi:hypothetical protein